MTSKSSSVRAQRRGDETKQRLIRVTKGLLAESDYQSITLEQISDAVGVAKSSILWHFGSKEGLLTEAVFELFEEVDQKINLSKANLATCEERVHYLLREVAEYFVENPEAKGVAITLLLDSKVPRAIHQRIREQWDRHVEEIQEFLSSDDATVSAATAASIMALMHGCYLQWHLHGCRGDLAAQLVAAYEANRPGDK